MNWSVLHLLKQKILSPDEQICVNYGKLQGEEQLNYWFNERVVFRLVSPAAADGGQWGHDFSANTMV